MASWKDRDSRIASLIQIHLSHGTKTVLCNTLGMKPYQLSRQLAGMRRLSRCVVDVAVELLSQDSGNEDVVAEIRTLNASGGSVARLDPMTIVFDPRKGTVEWGYR